MASEAEVTTGQLQMLHPIKMSHLASHPNLEH